MATKFPRNPTNKQVLIDENGIKWEYENIKNRWKKIGKVEKIPFISTKEPGIITPEIFNKLKTLKEATSDLDLGIFKISPGLDAYYYYFYSPDRLIDIRHKGNGTIELNVNEQKLIAYLYRYLCQGDKGKQGDKGEHGEPGIIAPFEGSYKPIYRTNTLSGEVYVPIPIGTYYPNHETTNISLRFNSLFEIVNISTSSQSVFWSSILTGPLVNNQEKKTFSELQKRLVAQARGQTTEIIDLSPIINTTLTLIPSTLLEIDINPITNNITIISNGVNADLTKSTIIFDKSIGLLKFNISAIWPQNTIFKARQRGPTGQRGKIPNNYLIMECCDFPDDANVRPDTILTHFRQDCEQGKLFANFTRLESQDAFTKITTDPTAIITTTGPTISGNYVAVEKIAGTTKKTTPLIKKQAELNINELNLQTWSPQPGCVTKRNYENQTFDWITKTDVPKCDEALTWFGPDGPKPGKYPHEIVKGEEPEKDTCCQDDFFYFPEAGEC